MRWLISPWLVALVGAAGCQETPAVTAVDADPFEYSDGKGILALSDGDVIEIEPHFNAIDEVEGVRCEIFAENGDRFGFFTNPVEFEEWSIRSGDEVALSAVSLGDGTSEWRLDDAVYRDRDDAAVDLRAAMSRLTGKAPRELHVWDNPLGEKLMRALTDPTSSRDPDVQAIAPINDNGTCSSEFFSSVLSCVQIKCNLGGVANPVCHACTGVLAACVIAAVAAALSGS